VFDAGETIGSGIARNVLLYCNFSSHTDLAANNTPNRSNDNQKHFPLSFGLALPSAET
jgi:hypothetical protein